MTSANNSTITVTQVDAVHRQLNTSIDLWFSDSDPVSIHTLAYAAHQIVHDLNRKNKGQPLFLDSPYIRPEKKQEFINLVKRESNFFKHADARGKKISPQSIEFEPSINEFLIGFTITGLQYLREHLTSKEIAFMTWQSIQNTHLLTAAGQQAFTNNFPIKLIEGLRSSGKKYFFNAFLELAIEN